MKSLLNKIHARLGDFWWYSLMLFFAARAADCLNVFVGLWLVPKYVEPSELGAVMPLTQFANFLAIPIAVFASTFRNELTSLAVNKKFGQMKTLMRSVFIATAIFLFLAIIICRLVLPAYLERIRIAEGSLAFLILTCAFVTTVAPIFQNALQSLKKFKTNALINLLGAPIRLFTMILAMPFRALSGYFVGQTSTPAFSIIASIIGLRKELSVPAEPYWTKEIFCRFWRLILIFGINAIFGGFATLVESTIIRQRLPEIDSAAYYMVTRFSDIAGFLAGAIIFTIFPFTAELSAKRKDTRPIIIKSTLAICSSNMILIVFFCCFGESIISLLPKGYLYSSFWWAIPWIIGITSINFFVNLYSATEISAFRFSYMKWMVPTNFIYATLLLLITGHGYFSQYLPASWQQFLSIHNIKSLSVILWWMTGVTILKAGCCSFSMIKQQPTK